MEKSDFFFKLVLSGIFFRPSLVICMMMTGFSQIYTVAMTSNWKEPWQGWGCQVFLWILYVLTLLFLEFLYPRVLFKLYYFSENDSKNENQYLPNFLLNTIFFTLGWEKNYYLLPIYQCGSSCLPVFGSFSSVIILLTNWVQALWLTIKH